ncbi:hypothetical protein [Flavobacterium sp.]|uniref:hypothetical protein n=1 Tax=Flavobacterium sp. TaxID=239 RepID=UPI00375390FA
MKIFGEFYFKKTDNGNLIGEFTNNSMGGRWDVECSNYCKGIKNNFECKYLTTWLEDDKPYIAVLEINLEHKENYALNWSNLLTGKKLFVGKAKIEDKNKIVGTYTNVID